MSKLCLQNLRDATRIRQLEWDPKGMLAGPLGALYRSNELAGETGEACNKVKKLVRERLGINGSRSNVQELADEIADIVICADLLANEFEIDLGEAVRRKFNLTSEANKLTTRL